MPDNPKTQARKQGEKKKIIRSGNASGRKEMKKSASTRKNILDTAARLFAANGYIHTLMSDIAEEAGVHITGLYYHFNSKDDLAENALGEVIRVNMNSISETVSNMNSEFSYEDKLRSLIHKQMIIVKDYNIYALAQRQILRELPLEAQNRQMSLIDSLADLWLKILEEGRTLGLIKKDIDVRVLHIVLLGSFDWSVETYRTTDVEIEKIAKQIADIIFGGAFEA